MRGSSLSSFKSLVIACWSLIAGRGRSPWTWLGLGLLTVYVRGLFLDVMDVDASQYASIAMEMLQNGHWLEVQHRHADYLDKPPLLFWTSALSFGLFGLHNWAYKLPSFLSAIAGVYAVYRFCLLFYDKETARNAAFILASSTGVLLLCNDVRTDTLLMAMTACAVWQLAAWLHPGPANPDPFNPTPDPSTSPLPFKGGAGGGVMRAFLLAALFLGLAMLAKGPIGLIVPAFAAGTHLLMRRDWRRMFDWRWLIAPGVILIVLAPMCRGLYHQFDLHPEKTVNDRTGVSGLYFYFWEQSFGRITGENVWKNDTSPLYFTHVYLWAFLPWSFLLLGALWRRLGDSFRHKFCLPEGDEAYSLGGFMLSFVALSMSQYKLPHYIFITLPWAAVLTARWLKQGPARGWHTVQNLVLSVLTAAAFLLAGFVFPTGSPAVWGILVILFGYLWVQILRRPFLPDAGSLVQRSALAFLGAAFVLNFHFYPGLLPHQSTAAVPRFAKAHQIPLDTLAFYNRHGHALDFYAQRILPKMETPDQVRETAQRTGAFWLYTNEKGRARLDSAGVSYRTSATFGHFQVALLNTTFLNPATRAQSLEPVYLLLIF